jgi:hypothetical protein
MLQFTPDRNERAEDYLRRMNARNTNQRTVDIIGTLFLLALAMRLVGAWR